MKKLLLGLVAVVALGIGGLSAGSGQCKVKNCTCKGFKGSNCQCGHAFTSHQPQCQVSGCRCSAYYPGPCSCGHAFQSHQ